MATLSRHTTDFLNSLGMFGWKLGLERMQALADRFGNPQHAFPAIHIAGSNGKGSVARLLESLLRAAGFRTGLYTSPHLVSPLERICIDGVPVDADRFEAALAQLRPALEQEGATYFETLTLLAFHIFRDARPGCAIVETGLGGRLDATNILTPECAVITTISLEHQTWLGATLAAIAREKGGIIKPGVPVAAGPLDASARRALRRICQLRNAPWITASRRVRVRRRSVRLDGSEFSFSQDGGKSWQRVGLGLPGLHQISNARLALAAASVVFPDVPLAAAAGRAWPSLRSQGRWEVLSSRPLLVVDAAHNAESAQALSAHIRRFFPNRSCVKIVIGLLEDKAADAVLETLATAADVCICVTPDSERGLPSRELANQAVRAGLRAQTAASVERAIAAARRLSTPEDLVVVTGSHYVAGAALQAHAAGALPEFP